jgi:ABC-type transport system substrate-binding protein
MTSEDVLWSMRQWGLSKHPRAGQIAKFWVERPGTETPDPYTVVVNSGEPVVDVIAQGWHVIPAGASTFIASKKQTEELGVEAASGQIAGTGPWEIVDHRTTEFWRMEAVETTGARPLTSPSWCSGKSPRSPRASPDSRPGIWTPS